MAEKIPYIYIGAKLAWEYRQGWQELVNVAKHFRCRFDPSTKMWNVPNPQTAQMLCKHLIDAGENPTNIIVRDFFTGVRLKIDDFLRFGTSDRINDHKTAEALQNADFRLTTEGQNVYISMPMELSGKPTLDSAWLYGLAIEGCAGKLDPVNKQKGFRLSHDHTLATDSVLRFNATDDKVIVEGVPKLLSTPFILDLFEEGQVFPHQKIGVKFLVNRKEAMLCDDMGLGKTMQSIVAAEQVKAEGRAEVLVVMCPVSLRGNWVNELKKWESSYDRVYIVPYSQLKMLQEISEKEKDRKAVMILDEAHYLKNPGSQRSKNVIGFIETHRDMFEHIWVMTGTPVTKDYGDIWSLCKIIRHPISEKYSPSRLADLGGNVLGTLILTGALKTKMLIRKKTEELNLPPKICSVVDIEVPHDTLMNNEMLKILAFGEDALAMEHLMRLKRLTAIAKIEGTIEQASRVLEEGRKVVIFTDHTDPFQQFDRVFRHLSPAKIDGSVNPNKRTSEVERFQNDDSCRVFIGQIKAAGVGITLTISNDVIFNDFSWLSTDIQQAEDRCHRIGTTGTVNVYYMADRSLILDSILLRKLGERSAEIATFEGSKQSVMTEIREWARNKLSG